MDGLRPPGLDHVVTRVPPLRGYAALLRPLAALLPVLFGLALLGGLGQRLLASRSEPAGMMDLLGMLCWLLGLSLAEPLQHMLLRLDLHRRSPVRRLATRARLLAAALLASLALSCALLPVHFAYDQLQELFVIQTLNRPPLSFLGMHYLLFVHMLAAPAFILASSALLRLLRMLLPARLAMLGWLSAGTFACMVPAALDSTGQWPLSLGQFSSWLLEFMYTNRELASPYFEELQRPLLLRLAAVWCVAIALCWLSLLAAARPWRRVRPLWLAAAAGIVVGGLRMLALNLRWTQAVLPLSAADWWLVLLLGCCSAWLVWLLLVLTGDPERLRHSFRRDSAWLMLLPAALLAMTIPALQAGDAGRLRILSGLLLLLPVLLLGFVLPLQAGSARRDSARIILTGILATLMLLPLPQYGPLLAMLEALRPGFSLPWPDGEQLRVWACLLLLLLLSWPGLLATILGQLRRSRTGNASAG
ncbi:hypothetical protein KDL44_10180 [bacterium]|nr:hypothetical protein [bacterium]